MGKYGKCFISESNSILVYLSSFLDSVVFSFSSLLLFGQRRVQVLQHFLYLQKTLKGNGNDSREGKLNTVVSDKASGEAVEEEWTEESRGEVGGGTTLKVVVFPLAHPSSLIFSFSQNSGVCKQEPGPCLLMRTETLRETQRDNDRMCASSGYREEQMWEKG